MNQLTKKQKIRRLAESAIMIALSTILAQLAVIQFPYGGSVTVFSQLPVIIISYRYGVKWGVSTGLVMAIIQLMFGLENFSYVSGLVAYIILIFADYIVAFTALGFGGMFRNSVKNQALGLTLGSVVVSVIRFLCHFISGVTIWGDYSNGAQAAWVYSLTYNGSYMLPELIITAIGAFAVGSLFDLKSPEIKRLKTSTPEK